jgi:uncharacterized protein (DUF1800 family)
VEDLAPVVDDLRRVARLLARAGFGATRSEIEAAAGRGYEATVDRLLTFAPASTRLDAVEVDLAVAAAREADEAGATSADLAKLQRWWLGRMATTSHPLEERLTLHWHGHFATALSKVDRLALMLAQNRTLRDHAAGNLRALCKAVTADAAMLTYLDGATSTAGRTNENYAREFLELFTLGRDAGYGQHDVVEAARAFTGYAVDELGHASFAAGRHDAGVKTVLGNTGRWGPADVVDIVLDRDPQGHVAAAHIAGRLVAAFHRPDAEPTIVAAVAGSLVASGYEIKPALRTLFLRPEFMDGPATSVKAPAELVAGAMRALGLTPPTTALDGAGVLVTGARSDTYALAAAAMGQSLFDPPNVAGWPAGAGWADTATSLARYNFAVHASAKATEKLVGGILDAVGRSLHGTTQHWMDRLGLLELSAGTQAAIEMYVASAQDGSPAQIARGVLVLLLASPDYNLR